MATLASLIVNIRGNTIDLEQKLRKSQADLDAFAGKMRSAGASMTKAGALLTAGVTLPIVGIGGAAIKAGMDVVESENLFEVSFGNMATAAREWSKTTSDALGLNEFELRRNSGTLFVMLESMGVAKDSAFDMATGMTQLAADMASFYNLGHDEAFAKIQSGISGEMEPLKRLGIVLNETTIKQVAYAHGIAEQGAQLTEQQKVQARYLVLMEQTQKAQGDLARTMDSPTNKLRLMRSTIEETAAKLGIALMPAFVSVVDILVQHVVPAIEAAVDWFANLSPGMQTVVVGLSALVAAAGPVLVVLGSMASGVGAVVAVLPVLVAALGPLLPFLGPAGLIAAGVAAVYLAWQHWDAIVDIAQRVVEGVKTWLIDKFQSLVVEPIRQKIEAIKGFFSSMYEFVVGGSVVPDMVSGIGLEVGRLNEVMVDPVRAATQAVQDAFSGLLSWLMEKLPGGLSQLFGGGDATGAGGGGGLLSQIVGGGFMSLFAPGSGLVMSIVSEGMQALGGLVWSGLQKIGGFFKGLFGGPSAEELAGRDVVRAWERNINTMLTDAQRLEAGNEQWKKSVIFVRDAYLAAGRSEQEALAIMERLWAAEKHGAGAVNAVLREMQAVIDQGVTPAIQTADMALQGMNQKAVAGIQLIGQTAAAVQAFLASLSGGGGGGVGSGGGGGGGGGGYLTPSEARERGVAWVPKSAFEWSDSAYQNTAFEDELELRNQARNSFAGGTPGLRFVNFGRGQMARLHGEEAVVPKSRAADFAARHSSEMAAELRGLRGDLRRFPRMIRDAVLQAGAGA